MVEEAVGMVEASAVEAAISLVAVVILLGLLAIASQNTKERTLRGTKIISGTTVISFLEVPLGTEIPIRMIIRYYGYNNYNDGDYYDGQYSPAEVTLSQETIVAVQKELAKLGYYHGPIDGLIGSQTGRAISWFQSVDKLSVTGRIDDPTLKALQIS
jgi:Putative peptidoglycan binding domain